MILLALSPLLVNLACIVAVKVLRLGPWAYGLGVSLSFLAWLVADAVLRK